MIRKEMESEGMDMEIDLSNLGTVNTMFTTLFSKLGVPIKTTISANVLEEALNGTVTIRPLPLGTSFSGKVEKQSAHFFGLDLEKGMMDCLYAKCTTPCITDCVMAELEKLGQKYRVALRIAKDPRFDRLPCIHKGTYADDCIVDRVTQLQRRSILREIRTFF
ncbi:chaperone protein dnaJ 39-like isoform X6 [Asparagus officinalis]|uniref:chaperone protein dnaJ 39-like isoform X6 n=1 Tax=Asparagus officinalis TaxID=4686 RepID=UPI00098E2DA8|nr:chaperone protein dnaJ 39-like isoform X6 [Asparagus officinalis]